MPVYNGERYVSLALDSLLTQTFSDFELIISDNASADRTEEICRGYASRDCRVHYLRNEVNLGAAKNYRRVFELASGEYFKWATCDDYCAPEFLARCIEVLDRDSSVVLAYPKTRLIDERGEVTSEYEDRLHLPSPKASERFMQLSQRLGLCNAMYGLIRTTTLRRTALLGNYIAADIPLLTELTLYGKFWEVPEFLFYSRFHPRASTSYQTDSQVLEFYDPKIKDKIPLTAWRHYAEYFRSVWRAPVGVPEKTRLSCFLMRRAIASRAKLARELSVAARLAVRRMLPG
jgi:glycosyltransferase involved in cell wall biosynthesis